MFFSTDVVSQDLKLTNLQKILDLYGVNVENGYIFECEEIIRRAMWAQGPEVPDNISLNALEERLHTLWGNYVDSGEQESAEKELLKRDFKISFGFNYQEKWENGEVVYYFTTANKWISQ